MKKILVIIIFILGFLPTINAQKCNKTYTIYLVRHCEKDLSTNNYSDPSLSECGDKRAENLSSFFTDINLDVIYSTDYTRTKSTAEQTANVKGLKINLYDSEELADFSKFLINGKKDALVVGHSNTTGVLAGLLVDEQIGAYDLDIYNRIYKVVFYENKGKLHLLHTTFECIY